MSNKHRKSIISLLHVLMIHVIKWYSQPHRRSSSWVATINKTRENITKKQKEKPSLNDDFIHDNWDKTLDRAIKSAENEMQQPATKRKLTWDEVFINKYTLLIMFVLVVSGIFIMFK